MSNATESRKSIAQLKELVLSCISKEEVRQFGDLRKYDTWEAAYCRCAEFLALAADAAVEVATDDVSIESIDQFDVDYAAALRTMSDAELYAECDRVTAEIESALVRTPEDEAFYAEIHTAQVVRPQISSQHTPLSSRL